MLYWCYIDAISMPYRCHIDAITSPCLSNQGMHLIKHVIMEFHSPVTPSLRTVVSYGGRRALWHGLVSGSLYFIRVFYYGGLFIVEYD